MKPQEMQRLKEAGERFASHLKRIEENPKQLDRDFLLSTLRTPLQLKEKQVGKYKIEIDVLKKGSEVVVVSNRNWIMMGYKPLRIILPFFRVIHKLKRKDGSLLMSDTPQEMFLQYDAVKNAKGNVLTAGLGLGLYVSMIAKKSDIKSITVVEIDKDVIKLINPKYPKTKIINENIWKFIKTTKKKFDYAYIDIHYSTGATEYKETILPMRELLKKKFPNMPIDFWGEEEMKTQYNNYA